MDKRALFIFLIVLGCVSSVSAETIIYDNISTTNHKILVLDDDLNIKLVNEYSYDVYIDDLFLGSYKKGEKIFIPDNSNVSIHIPDSNINTDIKAVWDIGKVQFFIAIMYFSGFLILIIMLILLYRRLTRRR